MTIRSKVHLALVGRGYRVMLVHDAPLTVDLAKADGEPEQETVLVRRHSELLDVEGRSALVIAEKQAPGLFVRLDPLALQRRRQVEHHHVRLVMSEDGGNIVPANRVHPGFEKGLDPDLFSVGVFRHRRGSFVRSEDERRDMNPTRWRDRRSPLTRAVVSGEASAWGGA